MRVPARWLSVQPTLPFRLDRNSRLRRMTTSLPSPRGLAMSSHVLVLRGSSTFESMTVCRMVPGCDQSYRLRSQKTPSRRNPSVTSAKSAPCSCTRRYLFFEFGHSFSRPSEKSAACGVRKVDPACKSGVSAHAIEFTHPTGDGRAVHAPAGSHPPAEASG